VTDFSLTHSALPACPQPLLVRSHQLVEVRPYAEEEEEEIGIISVVVHVSE